MTPIAQVATHLSRLRLACQPDPTVPAETWGKWLAAFGEMQAALPTSDNITDFCPDCGARLIVKVGKSGEFVGCPRWPWCGYTREKR